MHILRLLRLHRQPTRLLLAMNTMSSRLQIITSTTHLCNRVVREINHRTFLPERKLIMPWLRRVYQRNRNLTVAVRVEDDLVQSEPCARMSFFSVQVRPANCCFLVLLIAYKQVDIHLLGRQPLGVTKSHKCKRYTVEKSPFTRCTQ